MDYGPWKSLSKEGFQLINALLTRDPAKRISAADALQHPWFARHGLGERPRLATNLLQLLLHAAAACRLVVRHRGVPSSVAHREWGCASRSDTFWRYSRCVAVCDTMTAFPLEVQTLLLCSDLLRSPDPDH